MKIFLIGFMGSGKTYWGKKWSQHLGCSFIDIDDVIEEKEGCSIPVIFEKKGEPYFRQVESQVLTEMSNHNNVIVACGGGTACFNDNMQWMNQNGYTVYLKRSPAELYKNVFDKIGQRPLLKNLHGQQLLSFIEQELSEREYFYEQATILLESQVIDINSIDKILNMIAFKK